MATFGERITRHWQDAVNALLGLWLVISPWLFVYAGHTAAAWNAWVVGVIVLVAAIAALTRFHEWEEWVNAVLGLWLIISPWLTGYAEVTAAVWNHVIVGILTAVLAVWSAWRARHEPAAA